MALRIYTVEDKLEISIRSFDTPFEKFSMNFSTSLPVKSVIVIRTSMSSEVLINRLTLSLAGLGHAAIISRPSKFTETIFE